MNRDLCKLRIAKQIATNEGKILDKLSHKQRVLYMCLAENILATVERMTTEIAW